MYSNIREALGHHIGTTILDITQHDEDEWNESQAAYVALHLSDGSTLKFPIGDDGFEVLDQEVFDQDAVLGDREDWIGPSEDTP